MAPMAAREPRLGLGLDNCGCFRVMVDGVCTGNHHSIAVVTAVFPPAALRLKRDKLHR